MIRMVNVVKRVDGDVRALEGVNLEIERGEFVFLTGPSGAGKTTLLRLLLREELPTEGQVLVNGRNVGAIPASKVPDLRRSIGVGFRVLTPMLGMIGFDFGYGFDRRAVDGQPPGLSTHFQFGPRFF